MHSKHRLNANSIEFKREEAGWRVHTRRVRFAFVQWRGGRVTIHGVNNKEERLEGGLDVLH